MSARKITRTGFGLTAAYLFGLGIYAWCEWDHLLVMKPNEFGDFLAGSFGPLALFWLVCGYLQQGVELKQNTRALEMQADELRNSSEALRFQVEELKNSVEQQRRMAELTAQQLEIEVNRHKKEEAGDQARYSPAFELVSYQQYGSHAPGAGQFSVINSGAPVTIIGCKSNGPEDHLPGPKTWTTGEQIVVTPMRAKRNGVQVDIRLTYRRQDGKPGALRMFLPHQDDGTYSSPLLIDES